MICAWDKLLSVLPMKIRGDVNQIGPKKLQEIRLRIHNPPMLCLDSEIRMLSCAVSQDDLAYTVNAASKYSPWSAETVSMGYLTADGGHRIGLCGDAVIKNGVMSGIRKVSSINIRVAKDYPGVSGRIKDISGSILLIGPPGSGKTTLLRDLIRRIAENANMAVVDERGELFPENSFPTGKGLDILRGCPKNHGIEILLRTMGPEWIAVDEITAPADCDALIQAGWCGVKLLATAHAFSLDDLYTRAVYRPIVKCGLFSVICVFNHDKTYRVERIHL